MEKAIAVLRSQRAVCAALMPCPPARARVFVIVKAAVVHVVAINAAVVHVVVVNARAFFQMSVE